MEIACEDMMSTYPGINGTVWPLVSRKAVIFFIATMTQVLYGHDELEWDLSAHVLKFLAATASLACIPAAL